MTSSTFLLISKTEIFPPFFILGESPTPRKFSISPVFFSISPKKSEFLGEIKKIGNGRNRKIGYIKKKNGNLVQHFENGMKMKETDS